MAAHRELAAAAEREAVDRGDRRLGRSLEAAEDAPGRAATSALPRSRRAPSSSAMSAPATNARPAPVRMTPPTSGSSRAESIASPSSAMTRSLSALSLSGRLTVIVAMRSATASVMVSYGHARGICSAARGNLLPTQSEAVDAHDMRHLDSATWHEAIGFRYVDANGRADARQARRSSASTRCACRRRGRTCTSRPSPRVGDPGVGLRRARAEAVPLQRSRGGAARAAEVPSRAAAGEGAAAHSARAAGRRATVGARRLARRATPWPRRCCG